MPGMQRPNPRPRAFQGKLPVRQAVHLIAIKPGIIKLRNVQLFVFVQICRAIDYLQMQINPLTVSICGGGKPLNDTGKIWCHAHDQQQNHLTFVPSSFSLPPTLPL